MKTLTASLTSAIATTTLTIPAIANPLYLPDNTFQIYSYPAPIYSYPPRHFSTPYRHSPAIRHPYQIPASSPTPVLPGPTLLPVPHRSQIPIVIQSRVYPTVLPGQVLLTHPYPSQISGVIQSPGAYPYTRPIYRHSFPGNAGSVQFQYRFSR